MDGRCSLDHERAAADRQIRAQRAIIDHRKIIEALERRDTGRAEALTRQHTLDLAAHVEKNWNFFE